MPTFLAETVTAASGFDFSAILDTLFMGIERIIGCFTIFPLNIYLGASLAFVGVALFKGLKRTAK